jgi:hypothetical protein
MEKPQQKPRFEMRLPPELGARLDRWRSQQPGVPSRAEAARCLMEIGLKAEEAAIAKPKRST